MKPWYESKTLWVNGIGTLIAVLMALLGQGWVEDNPQMVALLGAAIGILNVVLRTVTGQPITFQKQD